MTDGTLALLLRIAMRWFTIPILVWLGMPESAAKEIAEHPDTLQLALLMVPVVIGIVEGWTVWVRKRGGKT